MEYDFLTRTKTFYHFEEFVDGEQATPRTELRIAAVRAFHDSSLMLFDYNSYMPFHFGKGSAE